MNDSNESKRAASGLSGGYAAAAMTATDAAAEQRRQPQGPRVTEADIDKEIAATYVFRPAEVLRGAPIMDSMKVLTIAVLVLRNGYTVVGKSACVSAENFDADVGAKYAIENAREQCWALLGYALREKAQEPRLTKRELTFGLNCLSIDAAARTPDWELAGKIMRLVEANRGVHPSLPT